MGSIAGEVRSFAAWLQSTAQRVGSAARRQPAMAGLVVLTALVGLVAYGPIVAWLVDVWISNPYYSHALLLVPVVAYVAWRRREDIAKAPRETHDADVGWFLLAGGLFVGGRLASSNYLQAWSLLPLLLGGLLMYQGRARTKHLAWPLGMLLLLLPIPFQEWFFGPLQELAATGAAYLTALFGLDVTYGAVTLTVEGNSFAVVPLCAGLSSTLSLFAITAVALLMFPVSRGSKVGVFSLVLPIALFSNMLRIVSTVTLAAWQGPETGLSFFHSGGALMLYGVALASIGGVIYAFRRWGSDPAGDATGDPSEGSDRTADAERTDEPKETI